MNDLITKEQASESDMRAISQMFARAANAVVDASELGKTVKVLQEEVQKLVGDTQRLREHISWLEQENVTLRGQRDEAQNALSDTKQELDRRLIEIGNIHNAQVLATTERDNARGEAKLWQEEAGSLEKERNGLKAEVTYLKGMLDSIWSGIKDHFEAKPIAPESFASNNDGQGGAGTYPTQSIDPLAPHYVHQPRDEYGRWVDPKEVASHVEDVERRQTISIERPLAHGEFNPGADKPY